MTETQDIHLIALYNEQPISADALGGTVELDVICTQFRLDTGRRMSNDEILARLITLRKAGRLNRKTPKPVATSKKETFTEYDAASKQYRVLIPMWIGRREIENALYAHAASHAKLPTSRQEVYDYIIKHGVNQSLNGLFLDEHKSEVERMHRILFPEFL